MRKWTSLVDVSYCWTQEIFFAGRQTQTMKTIFQATAAQPFRLLSYNTGVIDSLS